MDIESAQASASMSQSNNKSMKQKASPSQAAAPAPTIAFTLESRYEPVKLVGQGTSGYVALAVDHGSNSSEHSSSIKSSQSRRMVAVKKIPFQSVNYNSAVRILRELQVLKHFGRYPHPNILCLKDINMNLVKGKESEFSSLYLVTNVMETSLDKALKRNNLTEEHCIYLCYQLLKGVFALHGAEIIHRDIKPQNVLVNHDCSLALCDLGLARVVPIVSPSASPLNHFSLSPPTHSHGSSTTSTGSSFSPCSSPSVTSDPLRPNYSVDPLTEYVVTRYYRAPEILLEMEYGKPADIWSVACVFLEMLQGGKIFFQGENPLDQIQLILNQFGSLPSKVVQRLRVENPKALKFVGTLGSLGRQSLKTALPQVSDVVIDLIEKMLDLDPDSRFTAEECLRHPAFANYFDAADLRTEVPPLDLGPLDKRPQTVSKKTMASSGGMLPSLETIPVSTTYIKKLIVDEYYAYKAAQQRSPSSALPEIKSPKTS
eukprot:GILI01006346.1.p1 GENE.GILI01006346.1~~GILI01006346.1.p1  ORF type:complete len:486 (+),score=125.64 GILI01006346.1:240-1697(+)